MRAMENSLEASILERVRAADPEAIAVMYDRYGDFVYRTAYAVMGVAGDAEDVLQDVFLGLPEALRHYEDRGAIKAWLRTVAARTALMRLRRRRRNAEVALEAWPGAAPPESPAVRLTLETALASLPDALRTVFVLREVEGYTHAEIASILGIGIPASKVRLHRARKMLRDYLERFA